MWSFVLMVFSLATLAAAGFAFCRADPYRRAAEGNLEGTLKSKDNTLLIPEARWTYSTAYLQEFAATAPAGSLDAYVKKSLLGWDVMMAICLAVFALAVSAAIAVSATHLWLAYTASFCAGSAIIYGIADVAENRQLARIFSAVVHQKVLVDSGQARIANALTRLKMISLTLSLVGFAAFWLFRLTLSGKCGKQE